MGRWILFVVRWKWETDRVKCSIREKIERSTQWKLPILLERTWWKMRCWYTTSTTSSMTGSVSIWIHGAKPLTILSRTLRNARFKESLQNRISPDFDCVPYVSVWPLIYLTTVSSHCYRTSFPSIRTKYFSISDVVANFLQELNCIKHFTSLSNPLRVDWIHNDISDDWFCSNIWYALSVCCLM